MFRTTVPIPDPWPASKDACIAMYGYAAAINPFLLVDGEFQTRCWGKAIARLADREIWFESIDECPPERGVQGVRPLAAPEVEIVKNGPVLIAAFVAKMNKFAEGSAPQDLEHSVLRYYRLWRQTNSGVAEEIAPRHQAFFRWLDSSRDARGIADAAR